MTLRKAHCHTHMNEYMMSRLHKHMNTRPHTAWLIWTRYLDICLHLPARFVVTGL